RNCALSTYAPGTSRHTMRARIKKYALRSGYTPAPPAPAPAHRATPSAPRSTPAPEPAAASPVSAPTLTPLRWERRRVTLLRVSLIAASAPEALLETGRVIELLLDKIQSFGCRVEGRSPTGVIGAFGLGPTEDVPSQ